MPRIKSPLELTSRIAHILQHPSESHLQDVCEVLKSSLGCNIVSIYACHSDGYLLVANQGFSQGTIGKLTLKKGRGLVNHIVKTGKTLCLSDATTHLAFYYVQGIGEEKFHGFIGAPIRREGKIIGALIFQFIKKVDSTLEDIALIETISQQIAYLIRTPKVSKPKKKRNENINARGVTSGHFAGKVIKKLTLDEGPNLSSNLGQGYDIEKQRLQDAHYRSQLFLRELKDGSTTKEMQDILGAHIVMLADPMLLEKEEVHLKKNASAEQAVSLATMEIAEVFKGMDDPYMQQRSVDIIDVGRRVYHSLSSAEKRMDQSIEKAVYIVRQLPPSVLIEEGPILYGALIFVEENVYSHNIILAKSMGIPAVIISRDQLKSINEAKEIFVDGELGLIVPNPSSHWVEEYNRSHQNLSAEEGVELPPCKTKNGSSVTLAMNGGFLRDTIKMPPWIPEIGLFRTEFQFFTSQRVPSEEQLTENYTQVLEAADGRPTTLRILDAGADKQPPCLHFVHEDNPVLGDRSIRYLLKNSDIIFSQLRAMLKAQAATGGNMRILIPMVAVYEEVSRIRDHIIKVIRDLRREGIYVKTPEIGAMIEIPSCINLVPKISSMVDFYCVGTNDLLQYFVAVDRTNALVQYLYKWYHPTFLMALKDIYHLCLESDRPVSICGEMAGEMWGSVILLGLGFRSLSMDRQAIFRHHELVNHCTIRSLERLVERLIQYNTGLEILEQLQLYLDKWDLPPNLQVVMQNELNNMINPS